MCKTLRLYLPRNAPYKETGDEKCMVMTDICVRQGHTF